VGDVERRVQGRAVGVLEAVFRPEGLGYFLRAVGDFDCFVGLLIVRGGEGDVLRRVPVLGEDDVLESAGEFIDDGDDLLAFGDGKRAADSVDCGAEVVLHVDDEERVGGFELHDDLMVVQTAMNAVVRSQRLLGASAYVIVRVSSGFALQR